VGEVRVLLEQQPEDEQDHRQGSSAQAGDEVERASAHAATMPARPHPPPRSGVTSGGVVGPSVIGQTGGVLDRNGLEMLDRDECLRLLGEVRVGRVGITTEALPVVLPVNFVLDRERVVFSSAPGTKLYVAATGAQMAFEADDVDASRRSGWSVCVTGPGTVVDDPAEVRRLRELPLDTWAPEGEESYVMIEPQVVTGRRLSGRG
jgi:nitroimidazol reductase NimA-like FMN-containing flavoprotein (pyridoxamine 5'-phosphate oxidase superfamily)